MEHMIFVYGSLKRGFANEHLLRTASFLGEGTTEDAAFTMISFRSFPAILPEGIHRVRGEVFMVDDETLKRLDRLESEGRMYKRVSLPIRMDDGLLYFPWAYLLLGKGFECDIGVVLNGDTVSWTEVMYQFSPAPSAPSDEYDDADEDEDEEEEGFEDRT